LELQDRYGLDNILLGDFDLAEPDFTQLKALRGRSTLLLHVQDLHEPAILHRPLRNRIDIARDVIRADAFRRQNKTSYPPRNNVARSVGTVTIDNVDYGRYMGELQIDLCPPGRSTYQCGGSGMRTGSRPPALCGRPGLPV
jgi:hypothetical protein